MKTKYQSGSFNILEISAEETYAVRHPILRKGRPIADCKFENDELNTTIHLGIFKANQLVGVATLLKTTNPLFNEDKQYQLRGMAVLENFQGQQLGAQLLKYGEQLLKQINITRLWFNARETAINFYKNNNYVIVGQPFEINEIGTHYVMTKVL
nr:GNAT family N-acetyltransferase [uncultured Psychroserpens sp.]